MVRFKPSRLLFCVFVVILLLYIVLGLSNTLGERGYDILNERPVRVISSKRGLSTSKVTLGEICSPFSNGGMDNVTIIIKFGAGEASSRLPSYLKTLTPCKPNLLLFSDRRDSIDGIEIVDALANLHSEFRGDNSEFEVYDEIKRSNGTVERTIEGWKLDKYKFLPMMEFTAHLRPESNWYVFVELDTYVNWDNLYRFLSRFDPTHAHYFGSPVWPKGKPVWAHGGSGFVLSHAALAKLVVRGAMFAKDHKLPGTHLFGKDMQQESLGDEVLGQVLKEVGVNVKGYWPMFNGEKASTLPFGHEHWCEAIITLHHLSEEDIDLMRRFESIRQFPKTPLTFRELFDSIEPSFKEKVQDWSNMSEDIALQKGGNAGQSFEACFRACLDDSKCVQCEHSGDTCRLSHSIRLGHKKSRDGYNKWTSGWVRDRILSWRNAQPDCREGAHMVHSNP